LESGVPFCGEIERQEGEGEEAPARDVMPFGLRFDHHEAIVLEEPFQFLATANGVRRE
jgi:hypothetical protein